MPERIQRKRAKGWKMPTNTVYVGRPTKWGNPYQAGRDGDGDRAYLVQLFCRYLTRPGNVAKVAAFKDELRGKNLACWCPLDQPCHADILLKLANE